MSLPQLMLPPGLPAFKAGSHTLTPNGMYGQVSRHAGPSRRRRLMRTPTWIVQTELEVTQAQMESFFAWHEGPLEAGAQPFTAQVAKIGPGTQFWKAYITKVTAEHLEGNLHSIKLDLLLVDESLSSSTAPVLTTLGAEFLAPLLTTFGEAAPWALFAEVSCELSLTDLQANSALSAEVTAALQVVFGGAVAGIALDAEIRAGLEMSGGQSVSEALSAEVTTALAFGVGEDTALLIEMTAALSFGETTSGYVAAPAAVNVVGVSALPAPYSRAVLQYRPDGTLYTQAGSAGALFHANWYNPTTANFGDDKWVRLVMLTGTAPGYELVDTRLSGNFYRSWILQRNTVGIVSCTARLEIATDPDFLSIVSSTNVALSAELEV